MYIPHSPHVNGAVYVVTQGSCQMFIEDEVSYVSKSDLRSGNRKAKIE